MYRSRIKGKRSKFVGVKLPEPTLKGLDRLRALFHARWPQASYPTLSLVLEQVIVSNLQRLRNPTEMATELADFERRYGNKLKASSRPTS